MKIKNAGKTKIIRYELNSKKLQKANVIHGISAKLISELLWEIYFKNEAIWKYLDMKWGERQTEEILCFHPDNKPL